MEQYPRTSERDTGGGFIRPAPLPLEPNQTQGERDYARRISRRWNIRRRQTAARMYQRIALLSSGDIRNRMTMNMVGRWIVEESAARETSGQKRSGRRALLMLRWRNFINSVLEARRQSSNR